MDNGSKKALTNKQDEQKANNHRCGSRFLLAWMFDPFSLLG
jgi:hypothetical protein